MLLLDPESATVVNAATVASLTTTHGVSATLLDSAVHVYGHQFAVASAKAALYGLVLAAAMAHTPLTAEPAHDPQAPWLVAAQEEAFDYSMRADELVHATLPVPHSLVGLVIGVKGASIHRRGTASEHPRAQLTPERSIEVAATCHLSLDRSNIEPDPVTGEPCCLLHIHGLVGLCTCAALTLTHPPSPQRSGADIAATMVGAILQRHVEQHAWRAEPSAARSIRGPFVPQPLPPGVARELCFEEAAGDAIDAQPPPMPLSMPQRRSSVPSYF